MIEPQTVEIDGTEFTIQGLDVFEAMGLDKQVTEMLIPVFKNLVKDDEVPIIEGDGFIQSTPKSLDMDALFSAISEALAGLSVSQLLSMAEKLLKVVTVVLEGHGAVQLSNKKYINIAFSGKLQMLYKLLIKVMEVNKFTPFELMASGSEMSKIGTLLGAKGNKGSSN